jgi:YHS domain-containing protein
MNKHILFLTVTVIFTIAIVGYAQMHQHGMEKMTVGDQQQLSKIKDAYPLDRCIVTGQPLGSMGDPVMYNHHGREIRFCCQGCVSTFEKDPETYLKKMDGAIIEAQKDSYPLTTCPVTGKELGAMGEPVDYVYNNQLVRFCCNGCVSKFEENPEKYLQKLTDNASSSMELH